MDVKYSTIWFSMFYSIMSCLEKTSFIFVFNYLQINAFQSMLESRKITVSVRQTRGLDASAACGQLRNEFQKSPLVIPSIDDITSSIDDITPSVDDIISNSEPEPELEQEAAVAC